MQVRDPEAGALQETHLWWKRFLTHSTEEETGSGKFTWWCQDSHLGWQPFQAPVSVEATTDPVREEARDPEDVGSAQTELTVQLGKLFKNNVTQL